jgi:BMFP domain-containing protein YqiC
MSALYGATLVPAYGRDYKSRKEVETAFEAGKDFQLASLFHGSGYVSRSDFEAGDKVTLRYKSLREVTSYTVKGGAL